MIEYRLLSFLDASSINDSRVICAWPTIMIRKASDI